MKNYPQNLWLFLQMYKQVAYVKRIDIGEILQITILLPDMFIY